MARFIATLSILAVFTAAAGAPALKDPVPYLPTTVGSKWSYQYRGYAEDPTGSELVNVVTAVSKQDGMTVVSIAQVNDGKLGNCSVPTAESRDGLRAGYFSGENFVGCAWLLKLPAVAGTEWREHHDGMNEPLVREWYVIRRWERITVPAGKFDAERVDVTKVDRDGTRGEQFFWYARGVGLVKSVYGSGQSLVLNSFTPGAK